MHGKQKAQRQIIKVNSHTHITRALVVSDIYMFVHIEEVLNFVNNLMIM